MVEKRYNQHYLKYEAYRLDTYLDWPVTFLSPQEMASAGFYYTRIKDIVVCAFCPLVVGEWEEGDNPWTEHQRHASFCPFINGLDVGNVPWPTKIPCEIIRVNSDNTTLPNTIPFTEKYVTFASRLETFKNWPDSVTQRPEELAAAGLWYSGHSDIVWCFQCARGLRNWEKGDDPKEIHSKNYPQCLLTTTIHRGLPYIWREPHETDFIENFNRPKKEDLTFSIREKCSVL